MWGIRPILPYPPSGIWLTTRGDFCVFLRGGMGPSYIVLCARLCAGHLGIEVARLKPWTKAVFNRGERLLLYIYTKTLLLTAHFQGGDIWSDLTKFWGPTVGILTKILLKSQMPHICPGCPSGLTLIDALRKEILKFQPALGMNSNCIVIWITKLKHHWPYLNLYHKWVTCCKYVHVL